MRVILRRTESLGGLPVATDEEVELDRVKIGRGTDQDVQLPDMRVTLAHAEIRAQGNGWRIECRSENPVWINGSAVTEGPVKVGDALNFGRFRIHLHIAQPPLSRAIRALEEELGTPLFARGTRGVTLTGAGAALLPAARRLLRDAQAFRDGARQYAAGEAGTLAIGFVSTAAYNVLPRIVPAFRARRPSVRLALREATSDVQVPALAAGELDLAALTEHWPAEIADACVREYRDARWPAGAPASFDAVLEAARIHWLFRWLGDRPEWTLRERAHWRWQALERVAARLGLT